MIKLNGEIIEFQKYPNNEKKLNFSGYVLYENENTITFKYTSDEDLIELFILTKHIKSKTNCNLKLKITYMPYSRMDRVEGDSVFTLKYISEFINNLDYDSVEILEPHSNVTPALINNSISYYIDQNTIEEVFKDLKMNIDFDYIMFPDNGATSRYKHLNFKNVLIGHKHRDFESGEIIDLNIIGERHSSKKVLILDDLSSYGGTFIRASNKLKEMGFEEINLYVTHAENSIFKGDLFNHINKLITTDSLITENKNWENRIFDDKLIVKNSF